jgi:UDP-N-acetylglucosamine--N-acetylmuramyl-(pentapeptide) pyrophosphoryl-undecaprenol N-acetylglucosamine transferase
VTTDLVAVFSGGGTGGHLYPALSLSEALEERRPDVRSFFLGAERGIEAEVLPARGIPHALVQVEGFDRSRTFENLRVLGSLLKALGTVAGHFRRLKPRLVVVTGGYAGGPAGIIAALTRTRLVLQEQNSVPGITTRALSPFACEVHVAFPEVAESLPKRARTRVRFTGNPVRPPIRAPRADAAEAFGVDPGHPVVLVVGGSQGAEALNEAMLDLVTVVTSSGANAGSGPVQFLWGTGPRHLERVRQQLADLGSPAWIHTEGYIDDMPLALSIADLAVSRAGAMATSEFLAWGIPSILVPLPTAAADHQTTNAEALSRAGAALHLPQQEVSGEVLWGKVQGLLARPDELRRMSDRARSRGRPDAATEIAKALDRLLPPPLPLRRRSVT